MKKQRIKFKTLVRAGTLQAGDCFTLNTCAPYLKKAAAPPGSAAGWIFAHIIDEDETEKNLHSFHHSFMVFLIKKGSRNQ